MGNFIKKERESGSLHAIIIAVLFVSLMATLGVVFYQNFIAGKPKVVETDTSIEEESITTTRIAFNGDIYALDHPKDWKTDMLKTSEQVDKAARTHVTSPNGTVQIVFVVSPKSTGGTDPVCNIADGLKVSYYRTSASANANLTDVPVYLVESISDYHSEGNYEYKIGLTPDGGATHAAVGDSKCNVLNVGTVSTAVTTNNKLTKPTILAMIMFPKVFPLADVPIKEMKQVKDIMSTDDYEAAVRVLESARKE